MRTDRSNTVVVGVDGSRADRCLSEAVCPVRVVPARALDGSPGAFPAVAGTAECIHHREPSHVGS